MIKYQTIGALPQNPNSFFVLTQKKEPKKVKATLSSIFQPKNQILVKIIIPNSSS
jgi:hypothetical protein